MPVFSKAGSPVIQVEGQKQSDTSESWQANRLNQQSKRLQRYVGVKICRQPQGLQRLIRYWIVLMAVLSQLLQST